MNTNFTDELSLRRCRVVMEYLPKNSSTGLRWDENTPLVTNNTYQGRIMPISRLWTTVAYFPFPEMPESNITLPQTAVISEEQNCSLELRNGVPSLHLEMWQKGSKDRPTDFTNRAYNLCLGMDRYKDDNEDMWDTCQTIALSTPHAFCAPGHHPLHKSVRHHFFDIKSEFTPNNLPLLLIQQQENRQIQLKPNDELVTLILTNAILGRLPFVSKGLSISIKQCIEVTVPVTEWINNPEEALTTFLWSGNYTDYITKLLSEFNNWCLGNQGVYPAWAAAPEWLVKCKKNNFYAAILDTVSVYSHDYGLPHLSPSAFNEEIRQLRCDSDTKEFVWESGHSRATLLTSDWVKRKLHIQRNQMIEVKTDSSFGGTYSGERLDLKLST